MASSANSSSLAHGKARRSDPPLVKWCLILLTLSFLGVLVLVPVVYVFVLALANGPSAYLHALIGDADTRHAVVMTLFVAPIAVLVNTVFGIAAAWLIARFRFPDEPCCSR